MSRSDLVILLTLLALGAPGADQPTASRNLRPALVDDVRLPALDGSRQTSAGAGRE